MAFVTIENDKITSVFAVAQNAPQPEGYQEIEDDDPRLEVFLNGPVIIPTLTRRQFLIGAALAGIITQAEATAAANTGTVPEAIYAVFDTLPETVAFAARVTWATMTKVDRDEPLIAAVAASLQMTEQEVDQFFIESSAI